MPRNDDHSLEDLGREALLTRLKTLLGELRALRRKPSPDQVHDARVASRRMRAALEIFEDLLEPESYKTAYASVRIVTKMLGRPREVGILVSLLEELTAAGDMAENLCREYLQLRFRKRLNRQERRLAKWLAKVDPKTLRSELRLLIDGMGPQHADSTPPAGTRKGRKKSPPDSLWQPTLFLMHEDARERARQLVAGMSVPILSFSADAEFARAADHRIHELRIAAKKLRYAMEVLDPVWPGGLQARIAQARALQDAGGTYHDWCVLCEELKREIRRLDRRNSEHLRFQIGRLSVQANSRRKALRKLILPELLRLQSALPSAAGVSGNTGGERLPVPGSAGKAFRPGRTLPSGKGRMSRALAAQRAKRAM